MSGEAQGQYRILVADDEHLARYAFRVLISRLELPVTIVGEVENGRQAVELALRDRPDIVVMDIKMPGIDGIEASRQILARLPDTKILLLTAYDNFSFAQEAVNIGVAGYLLKPLKGDEVEAKLRAIIASGIAARPEARIDAVDIRMLVKANLVRDCLAGDDAGRERWMRTLDIDGPVSGGVVLASLDPQPGSGETEAAIRAIYRNLEADGRIVLVDTLGSTFLAYVGYTAVIPASLESAAREVARSIATGREPRPVRVSCGSLLEGLESLAVSYRQACHAFSRSRPGGEVAIYDAARDPRERACTGELPYAIEDSFFDYLRVSGADRLKPLFTSLLEQLFAGDGYSEPVREYVEEFIVLLVRRMKRMGIFLDPVTRERLADVPRAPDALALKSRFSEVVLQVIDQFTASVGDQDRSLVERVFAITEKEAFSGISLEMIADRVNLSPQYVSRMFKRYYGRNFIDFITDKRLEEAKRLLRTTDLPVNAVAARVGYVDANYFIRTFRHHTGVTPKNYRNMTDTPR